jgi:hypothetical protein
MGRMSTRWRLALAGAALALLCMNAPAVPLQRRPALMLEGYSDAQGAISVQQHGDTVDPYFVLQALLLAHDFGLDASIDARRWADWLLARQKPDATFDRFCRAGPVWAPCKTADADDALLALWLKFMDTLPEPDMRAAMWRKSRDDSQRALSRLMDPARGIYLVSPVYPHGLFMDNLGILSYRPPCSKDCARVNARQQRLEQAIHDTFWDTDAHRFLVSTQPGQKEVRAAFYPDQVTQLYPLLFTFKLQNMEAGLHYRAWMHQHRAAWLSQSKTDFAWGLVAVVALKAHDLESAGCWLRESASARDTAHWIVTDEVARQILLMNKVQPAADNVDCL